MMEGYQKDFPECPEYVLNVPQATAVIFSKKVKTFFILRVLLPHSGDWQLIVINSCE